MIVATHDLDSNYLKAFDEVLLMEAGKLLMAGTPDEVIKTEAYQKLRKEKSV